MDQYYNQNYAQSDAQRSTNDDAMTGMDMSHSNPSGGQMRDGMQQATGSQNNDRQTTVSGDTSHGGQGDASVNGNMHNMNNMNMAQMGMFPGANMNNFGMGNNANMMFANPMSVGQQQANINLMTHMMNTNPVYAANMMSTAMAAANASSQMHQQQQQSNQMGVSPNPAMKNQNNNMGGNMQDANMMNMLSSMNPMAVMQGNQMMPGIPGIPGMMMNPMLQNMQGSMPNQSSNQDGKNDSNNSMSGGMSADQMSNNGQNQAADTIDVSVGQSQMHNNPYQNMSRQNTMMQQPRRPSMSQIHRKGSQHGSHSVQQSPTQLNFPASLSQSQQNNPVVPVMSSGGFPEHGGNGPAFATGGVSQDQNSQGHDTYRNAYSSTGFDMITVLTRVATRKNPLINIGNVDLSCAFVVCDTMQHDIPIVYCSENFERLTGYTKHEILGRNCRFLQAPSGHVQAGVKRKYVDDDVVLQLKNAINSRSEVQVSVINYRKGGQPFMNLLTMIPIPYDTDEIKYYVGFQVDLVEQPHSVTKKNPNGTYTINYQRGLQMPRYVFTGQEGKRQSIDSGQTIPRDEVSTVLSTTGSGESDLSARIWDKVLLENTDDVVFVLSLKGLFLYLSPSCNRILEYDPNELMGAALSSVCHPSDIVPVTRELKDTTSGADVSVVFRIRRKENGYMWFEGHGSLYVEQGKGRKSIVLVGRERPVYTLKHADITASGGVSESEVWTKLSTSGMFLYVSSSIRSLLDKQPSELVGTSMQSLMRPDSRSEFGRILEIARSGKRAQARHELVNRRGQVLQAFSTVHPGDATEGSKPTFFVAQTKLLKYTRPAATPLNNQRQPSSNHLSSQRRTCTSERSVSRPASVGSYASPSQYMSTFEAASTFAGGESLPLGHQDEALADDQNLFDELKTTRSTSWQYELRQMEKRNRLLAEELQSLLAAKKKRKRRKPGVLEKECANCHAKQTPEWRRGPSGNRDLCNSCGLRWAKQQGRISPRTTSQRSAPSVGSDHQSDSPRTTGHSQSQSVAPQRQPSGSGSAAPDPARQENSPSAGQSVGAETRSIDETLARSGPTPQPNAQQPNEQIQGGAALSSRGASAASPRASKATKIDNKADSSPSRSGGASRTSVPTKFEEGQD